MSYEKYIPLLRLAKRTERIYVRFREGLVRTFIEPIHDRRTILDMIETERVAKLVRKYPDESIVAVELIHGDRLKTWPAFVHCLLKFTAR